jgi:GNAT superfamily N-acetyltransferase
VWSQGGATWTWTPRPHAEALLLFPEPRAHAEIGAGLRRAAEHGARTAGCWSAGADDALGAALAAHGFEEGWRPHWMALDLAAVDVEGGVDVPVRLDAEIGEAAEVPEWDAYGQALLTMARARPFVARAGGALAGFAWLHEGVGAAGPAGLFDLVVFPPHRRRGIGRTLTLAAARAAAALGHRALVLNATGDGQALYATLGFASLGEGRTWWRHHIP